MLGASRRAQEGWGGPGHDAGTPLGHAGGRRTPGSCTPHIASPAAAARLCSFFPGRRGRAWAWGCPGCSRRAATGEMCPPRHSGCPCAGLAPLYPLVSCSGVRVAAAPRACPWHLFLLKQWGWCVDKVPAVPFSGPFPALPGPEGKHSWHICHVRLNTASFRKEKKSNKRKSGSSTAPFSVLLHLSFSIPALNNTLYGEA